MGNIFYSYIDKLIAIILYIYNNMQICKNASHINGLSQRHNQLYYNKTCVAERFISAVVCDTTFFKISTVFPIIN